MHLNNNAALVALKTIFYKNNAQIPESLTYYLTMDSSRGVWLFDFDPTCGSVPKRLSIGIQAKVVTAKSDLLLRQSSTRSSATLEEMPPSTIVTVLEGPVCGVYRSVNFWWWKVQSPSGKVGWIVEGYDVEDPIFIQPAP